MLLRRCATVARGGAVLKQWRVWIRMDFSKLDQNEKMALYAAIVVFLAGLISNWGGLLWLSVLAALGVAVVVFLPQFAPNTSLPGSRGTLLATLGIVAVGAAVIELLRWIEYTINTLGSFGTLLFLVTLIAAAVMAWAGWQALQREGGKWQFGMAQSSAAPAAPADSAAAPPPAEPPAAAPPPAAPPPAAPPPAAPPPAATDQSSDDSRTGDV